MQKQEVKRKEFVVRIGPKLKDVLNQQKENVKKVTYDCVPSSEYEAGEILAIKIKNAKLL